MGMSNGARIALYLAMALMLAVPIALVPEGVSAQGGEVKDMTLYLHNVTESRQVGSIATLRTMDTVMGTTELNMTVRTANSVSDDWYLYPTLANDTTLTGNVTVHVWALRTATSGNSPGVTIRFTLSDIDANGNTVATIATASLAADMLNDWKEYRVTSGGIGNYTVAKGHSMHLLFIINGNSANEYQLAWGDSVYRSRLDVFSRDYLTVASVETLDHLGVPQVSFATDAADKTVIIRANVTDPFGGYDVRAVWCTLVDPFGSVLLAHSPMAKTAGFFNTYLNEYSLSWDYTGADPGQYNVTVDAVDNSGWYYRYPANPDDATFGGHLESAATSFWIGGLPELLTVHVTDAAGDVLVGARAILSRFSGITGADGNATIMVFNGTYVLTVEWQGIVVASEQVTVSGPTLVNVIARVYSPVLRVVDDHGTPVGDAVMFVLHPNGTTLAQLWRTDAQGEVVLPQMAVGVYGITVQWRGTTVFDGTVDVLGAGPYVLDAMVYTLSFTVIDDTGLPLDLAQVVVTNSTTGVVIDSRMTDLEGNTSSRLPVGAFDIVVYWREALVYNGTTGYLLDRSSHLTLRARVYTVNITVVDTAGLPLERAIVVVKAASSDTVIDTGQTSSLGRLSARMPASTFDIDVFWRDLLVNTTTGVVVTGNAELTLVGSVFWVDVTAVDSHDQVVSAAYITFTHASGQDFGTQATDLSGLTTFRLPHGSYTVDVVWFGSSVFIGDINVSDTTPIVLHLYVYYLSLEVVDTAGQALEGASVELWNSMTNRPMGMSFTNLTGFVVYRVPVGSYRTLVIWAESPVYDSVLSVPADTSLRIVALVYHVPFHAIDGRSTDLADARLEARNTTNDRLMGTVTTDPEGNAEMRLPLGVYEVTLTWEQTVVHRSIVRVSSDAGVLLRAAVYYVSFHVVDARSHDLEGAVLMVANSTTTNLLGSVTTGATGTVELRLPTGIIQVSVAWKDTNVYTGTLPVDGNKAVVLRVAVYYLSVHIVDARSHDLAGAVLVASNATTGSLLDSAGTPGNGTVELRLPTGTIQASITWQDTNVYMDTVLVDGNDAIVIYAAVYYLAFHVVDGESFDLEDARLVVSNATNGLVLGTMTTGTNGTVEMRMPQGYIAFDVFWMTIKVNSTTGVSLHANGIVTVRTQVHYLTVKVIGSDGAVVHNAKVLVERGIEVWAAGSTNRSGLVRLRLPYGDYMVNMTYRTTYYWTPINIARKVPVSLTASTLVEIKLKDTEYPIPFYKTNMFIAILVFVIIVVVILLLVYYFLIHKKRAGKAPAAEAGEGEDASKGADAKEAGEAAKEDKGDADGEASKDGGEKEDIDSLLEDVEGVAPSK